MNRTRKRFHGFISTTYNKQKQGFKLLNGKQIQTHRRPLNMLKPPRGFSAAWAKNWEKSGQGHRAAGSSRAVGHRAVAGRRPLGRRWSWAAVRWAPDLILAKPAGCHLSLLLEKKSLGFCSSRYGSHVKKHDTRHLNGPISSMREKSDTQHSIGFPILGVVYK